MDDDGVRFQVRGRIDAPPERIWPILRDVERWPDWTDTVRSAHYLQGDVLQPGARVRVRQPGLLPATWTIDRVDEGRAFWWSCRGLGVTVHAGHVIEPAAGGSWVELTIRMRGRFARPAARLFGRLNERYLTREIDSLTRHVLRPTSTKGVLS